MLKQQKWLRLLGTLVVLTIGPPASASSGEDISLAQYVPADVHFFCEVRDLDQLADSPVGRAVSDLLSDLLAAISATPQHPPQKNDLKQMMAEAVGAQNPQIVELLFTGRLAIAADNWSRMENAVLLLLPDRPSDLESALTPYRQEKTASLPVRRYRLTNRQELACNGHIAVLGLISHRSSLYFRAVNLLTNERAVPLSDLAEFQERIATLPQNAQIVFYATTGRSNRSQMDDTIVWWPANWPWLTTLTGGLTIEAQGITLETSGRLNPQSPRLGSGGSLAYILILLPSSGMIAWSYSLDFAQAYQQWMTSNPPPFLRFYIDVMQAGLEPQALERDLLAHLGKDSIVLIGEIQDSTPSSQPNVSLPRLPALATIIEVDAPRPVEAALNHMANNLIRLLNLQTSKDNPLVLKKEKIQRENEEIVMSSIELGRLFSATNPLVSRTANISWAVLDQWLIVGTHPALVRDIIQAALGAKPFMPDTTIVESIDKVYQAGSSPNMLLVAQPQMMSEMIDSWLAYLSRHYPQIFELKWWQQLRRQQRESNVQLGILPNRKKIIPGQIEIAQTLPNWPAYNRLQPGDRIVSVDGKKLDEKNTFNSLRKLIAERPHDNYVRLGILRNEHEISMVIPMPMKSSTADRIQPLHLLQQASDILRLFSTASYVAWQPAPDLVRTRLELQLASPSPASRPTTSREVSE